METLASYFSYLILKKWQVCSDRESEKVILPLSQLYINDKVSDISVPESHPVSRVGRSLKY